MHRFVSEARKGAQYLAGSLCGSALLRPFARRVFVHHTNIIYYHLIGENQAYSPSDATVVRFSQDLTRLRKVFTFATLKKVCEHNQSDSVSDTPLLALTFDDGFRMSGTELMQVLNHHNVKATQFLIMSCMDNLSLMWRHKISAIASMVPEAIYVTKYNDLAARAGFSPIRAGADLQLACAGWSMARKDEWADELWRACDMQPVGGFLDEYRPYFTWKEVQTWLDAGHSVGLHTQTHPYCSRLNDDEIEEEVARPGQELRKRLCLDFLPFAYPFGDRLPAPKERALLQRGIFDSAFGIRGFSPRGTAHYRLERAGIAGLGLGWSVFAKPMILAGVTRSAAT
jgi:peptidoglycan/xylan/chitin deacetylase (PgdA/CDA1 family)